MEEFRTQRGVGAPRRLWNVGDDAIVWTEEPRAGEFSVRTRSRVDNLSISVTTSGKDWSGGQTFPTADSANLREDLGSGAESITAAVARSLPATLPRATLEFDWSGSSTSTGTSTTTTIPPPPVWDPCALPESAVAAAGLDPASKKPHDGIDRKGCRWRGDWYDVDVTSSAESFEDAFYDAGKYTRPRPMTVGERPTLMLHWELDSDYFCDLALDAPQGERLGVEVGVVLIEASTNVKGRRNELCIALARLADPLVRHVPPGR
ncbi:hypothetical protein [Nocardia gipuzkoensis]|uniref:hypothetical protein n=1 Tax=Nocardia gipuzkoensis TaxID=2749991 RepID=UPI003EE20C22